MSPKSTPAILAATVALVLAAPLGAGLGGGPAAPSPLPDAVPAPDLPEVPVALPAAADRCPNPAADALCANAAVPGGAGCLSAGLVTRGLILQTLAKSQTQVAFGGANLHQEQHFVNQNLLGLGSATAIDSECDASANSVPSACGSADVTDVNLNLLPLGVNIIVHADVLTETGCSQLGGALSNGANVVGLSATLGGLPLKLPLALGANTVINIPLVGFIVVNEQSGFAGGNCPHANGAALRVVLLDPLVEIIVSWVSTIVCKVPTALATTSLPSGPGFLQGVAVRDNVVAAGVAGLPAPTGSATFFFCQPAQVTAAGCPAPAGANVGSAALVLGSATGPTTTSTNVLGKYCWRAEYGGDDVYLPGTHTNADSECVEVTRLIPTLATTSIPTGSAFPTQAVRDSITVAGTGPLPTGTVTFFLCSPGQVTAAGCPNPPGTQVGPAKILAGGAATSDPTANTLTLGKYCWRAAYSGDAIYVAGSHTNAVSECFTVAKIAPTIATTSSPTGFAPCCSTATDRATLTGPAGAPTPTGVVAFFLCGDAQIGAAGCSVGGTKIGASKALAGGIATSDGFPAAAWVAELYCWRAEYGGDSVYLAATHTNRTTECFDPVYPQ